MKQLLSVLLLLFATLMGVQAQDVKISGRVTDADSNLPIETASISVKGKSRGVTTNANGDFSLDVPTGSTLVITSVGYERQEIAASSSLTINLVKEANNLSDVVVVGYGTQKRTHLTGSVGTLSMKAVEDLPVGNLSEALKGQIVGVSVSGGFARTGEAATVTIRNPIFYSKDGGSKDPLFEAMKCNVEVKKQYKIHAIKNQINLGNN